MGGIVKKVGDYDVTVLEYIMLYKDIQFCIFSY